VFPSQIETALLEVHPVRPPFRIIVDHDGESDTIEVCIPVGSSLPFFDEPPKLAALKTRIVHRLKERLDLEARVSFLEARSLSAAPGAKRVLVEDRRSI
jgi:phenylacetate-CoA ligase